MLKLVKQIGIYQLVVLIKLHVNSRWNKII